MLNLLATAVACVSPVSYGAVAGDGRGDEQALAASIAEATARGAAVCLPAGVFELGRTAQIASVVIDAGPVILRGVGPATILRMTGDGRKSDWRGIELRAGARGVIFEDLAIDSLATTNTEEQTHLIQLSPGVSRVTFRRVQFGPMRRPDQRPGIGSGGDCLRLFGEFDQPTQDIVISRSNFLDCDRSGISLQRGVRRVSIVSSTFRGTGDTSIDFEPTAPGAIQDIAMVDLRIFRPSQAQGSWAITIAGFGEDLATRVTVANCMLQGGGISLLNVGQVVIAGNDIIHGSAVVPTVSVRRRALSVRVEDNLIVRPRGSPPEALVDAQHNNGFAPTEVSIIANQMRQETSAPVVASQSVARIEIFSNRIQYAGDDREQFVIDTHAVIADAGRLGVIDNTIHGNASAAVHLDARDRVVDGVEVRGNVSDSITESVACNSQPTGQIRTVVASDNDFAGASSRCAALAAEPEPSPAQRAAPR